MAFSGFQDFNPEFSDALQRMIADRPGVSVYSGFRTREHQARLYEQGIRKHGIENVRHWVAPPGHSRHEQGIAADLTFATPEDKAWVHANAENYGLNFRMSHEDWHIEPINGKAMAVHNETGQVAPLEMAGGGQSGPVAGFRDGQGDQGDQGGQLTSDQQASTIFQPRFSNPQQAMVTPPPVMEFPTEDFSAFATRLKPKREANVAALLQSIRGYS
jgi:hypothetical protein